MHVSGPNLARIFVNFRPESNPKLPARLTILKRHKGEKFFVWGKTNNKKVDAFDWKLG